MLLLFVVNTLHLVHTMNKRSKPHTRSADLGCESACRLPPALSTVYTDRRHLLL